MRFGLSADEVLTVETPQGNHSPRHSTDGVTFSALMAYPGIELTITLPDLIFTRCVHPNFTREIAFGDDPAKNVSKEANITEMRYKDSIISSKQKAEVSTKLLRCYLNEMLSLVDSVVISRTLTADIESVMALITADVSGADQLVTKMNHSRFLSGHRYYRTFDNDPKRKHSGKDLKACLRETINPELVFSLERCKFTNALMTDERNVDYFMDYFKNILIHQIPRNVAAFKDMIKKCLKIRCTLCDMAFEGVMITSVVADHYMAHHFVPAKWHCASCDRVFTQDQLAKLNWHHDCENEK